MNFTELITGKRVAMVGAATYLVGKNYGPKIDKHDIVVRFNDSFPVATNRVDDYGARCDILCMNGYFQTTEYRLSTNEYKARGVKLIVLKTNNMKALAESNSILPTVQLGDYVEMPLMRAPYTGALLIEKITRAKPASLYLTGIDFYLSQPNDWWYKEYRAL